MALTAQQVDTLTRASPEDAWQKIIKQTLKICSRRWNDNGNPPEITSRDRAVGELDLLVAGVAWDLWKAFGNVVERNAEMLVDWWKEPYNAKAVLILDGLSLRELPWILIGAKEHGFTVQRAMAYGAEIPSETNAFAKALGFASRSQLQNNGGGRAHGLTPCVTECVDLPWVDCAELIDHSRNWVFWHHWPDSKVHHASGAGQGLDTVSADAAAQLTSKEFWGFVERLATGRRLVITSDHGYAATGLFYDAKAEKAKFLRKKLKSRRMMAGAHDPGPFVPPVTLQVDNEHGPHLLALGRWKWTNQGGYPTLAHGGLSLLEMLCPFVELTK